MELLASAASPLISSILGGLRGPGGAELPADAHRTARELGRLRRGERAAAEVSRDLAVLQSLLIGSLRDEGRSARTDDFAHSVQRLAEIFGSLYGAVAEHQRPAGGHARAAAEPRPARDPAAAELPGGAELDWWLEALVAEHTRYGHPFALALVEVEGLERIEETRGRRSAEWMLTAIETVIRNQIRIVDHAFRVGGDELCVLAPNVDAGRLRRMADRLSRVVGASQAPDEPRVEIAVGVSACPEHGRDGGALLETAEDALYAAKAAGQPVAVASPNGSRSAHEARA